MATQRLNMGRPSLRSSEASEQFFASPAPALVIPLWCRGMHENGASQYVIAVAVRLWLFLAPLYVNFSDCPLMLRSSRYDGETLDESIKLFLANVGSPAIEPIRKSPRWATANAHNSTFPVGAAYRERGN